jgi:hypothetical protein
MLYIALYIVLYIFQELLTCCVRLFLTDLSICACVMGMIVIIMYIQRKSACLLLSFTKTLSGESLQSMQGRL